MFSTDERLKTLETLDGLSAVEHVSFHDMLRTAGPGTVALGYVGCLASVAVVLTESVEREDVPEPRVNWLMRHDIGRPAVSP